MKLNNRKSIKDSLNRYDYLKESGYIEITEWTNDEGYDIDINGVKFSLTHGELDAINYLTMTLRFNNETD